MQLGLSEIFTTFIAYSGMEGPSESVQFQGLPEAILGCLPSILRSFSAGSNVSTEHSSTAQFLSLLGPGIGEDMSEE